MQRCSASHQEVKVNESICEMERNAALDYTASFGGSPVELAGDLPKLLSSANSPYLVVADVFVPVGKVVTIEPGTVILFKNFTGVHIQGTLIADGSSLNPVILTSENDKDYNPQSKLAPTPYDWNGIYIHKDGLGTDLRNMKLMYSVKGIVSETKYIRITNCVFRENGRSNLVIEERRSRLLPGRPSRITCL